MALCQCFTQYTSIDTCIYFDIIIFGSLTYHYGGGHNADAYHC